MTPMALIDHVFCFTNEAQAKQLLPNHFTTTEQQDYWDTSIGIYNQKVTVQDAVWNNTDPMNPILVSPPVYAPGWWCSIALKELSYTNLSQLRFAMQRNEDERLPSTLVYQAADFNAALFATAKIEPVFTGVNYPFNG